MVTSFTVIVQPWVALVQEPEQTTLASILSPGLIVRELIAVSEFGSSSYQAL